MFWHCFTYSQYKLRPGGLSNFLLGKLSTNGHDRRVEASLSCLFLYGPMGFMLSFIAEYIWANSLVKTTTNRLSTQSETYSPIKIHKLCK